MSIPHRTMGALACIAALNALACNTSDETVVVSDNAAEAELGALGLRLTGTSASGERYRLHGTFVVTPLAGGEAISVSTTARPDAEVLRVDLPAGRYSILLAPGFHVERVTDELVDAGPEEPRQPILNVALLTPNPQRVTISAGADTAATFRFRVNGSSVELGSLSIEAEFVEAPAEPPACKGGQPRRLVVQWDEVPAFDGASGPHTFQAILTEGGGFAFLYDDFDLTNTTPTIGFQGPGGAGGLQLDPSQAVEGVAFDAVGNALPAAPDFIDISETGVPLALADDAEERVDLGFPFAFMGSEHTSVTVSSNGFVLLTPPPGGFTNEPLPASGLGALLAPFWDDLNPEAGGSVRFQLLDGCVEDCSGELGGAATLDSCGICSGGDTGVSPDAALDCLGECFGSATLDACGVCGGTSTDPAGCPQGPDMIVDGNFLRTTISEDVVDAGLDQCLFAEGCVNGPGLRRVIRFGTRIANIGTQDVNVGAPSEDNPRFEFDQCHEHFHFEGYASYDLIDPVSQEPVPIGNKNGFCLIDLDVWDPAMAVNGCNNFDCSFQGISVGCADIYGPFLDCQWIDITDVAPGEYDLQITVNSEGNIEEINHENNQARVRVQIADDSVTVVP